MSSTPSYRTDAPGIVLPPKIAAIAADHRKHPEKGRLLDIIMAYRKQNISNASNSKKKRRAERNIAIMSSSKQFTYRSLTPCGLPVFDGSIGICSTTTTKVDIIKCTGYLLSILPDDNHVAVIVLKIKDRGMLPSLCPVSSLDAQIIQEGDELFNMRHDKKKDRFCRSTTIIPTTNISVFRVDEQGGNIQGHMLLDGHRSMKGRVVDERMLAALEAGCLRTGEHTDQAFYTLDRVFSVRDWILKDTAHIIIESVHGMRLSPAGRYDVMKLIRWGESVIEERLSYHHSMQCAIQSLDEASKLGPPSIDERIFQVSIGGDTNTMVMGKFLPCQKLQNNPNIDIKCACGFTVDCTPVPNKLRSLLRCKCHE